MQIRKTTETITHLSYVADDGAEFSTKRECGEHEWAMKQADADNYAGKLAHFDQELPFNSGYEDSWTWYYVKSQRDLEAVILANYCEDCEAAHDYKQESYPCWIVATTDGNGYGAIYSAKEVKVLLEQFLTELSVKFNEV